MTDPAWIDELERLEKQAPTVWWTGSNWMDKPEWWLDPSEIRATAGRGYPIGGQLPRLCVTALAAHDLRAKLAAVEAERDRWRREAGALVSWWRSYVGASRVLGGPDHETYATARAACEARGIR